MPFNDYLNELPEDQTLALGGIPTYPYFTWVNGDDRGRTEFAQSGGFWLKAGGTPEGVVINASLIQQPFGKGKNKTLEEGYGFPALYVAVLAFRQDAYVRVGDTDKFVATWDEAKRLAEINNEKAGTRTRYVVLVGPKSLQGEIREYPFTLNGEPYYGPFMLTARRTNGLAMQKAMRQFQAQIVDALIRKLRRNLPPYTFWCPIKVGEAHQPNANYDTFTTPPVLALGERIKVEEYADKAFIGPDALQVAKDEWERAQEWAMLKMGEPILADVETAEDEEEESVEPERPFRPGQARVTAQGSRNIVRSRAAAASDEEPGWIAEDNASF